MGKGYDYYSDTDYTFSFGGTLNTSGLENIPLAYSAAEGSENYGFNLPESIYKRIVVGCYRKSSGLSLNTSKAVYFTKDNIQYTYANGVGTPEGASGHIPPMQGFFVKTSLQEMYLNSIANKGTQLDSKIQGIRRDNGTYRLSLTGTGGSDEMIVRFDNNAKED